MLPPMKRLAAVLGLGIALAACGGAGGASPSTTAGLQGTSWTLVKIGDQEITLEAPPTLTVGADGAVSGSTGCNTYNGTATIEGNSISFGPLATTRVFCSGAPGVTETAFLAAINEVEAFAIDSQGRLVLEDGVVMLFGPAEEVPAS